MENNEQTKEEPKKCGCGNTKDVNGNCDGSHLEIKKETPKPE